MDYDEHQKFQILFVFNEFVLIKDIDFETWFRVFERKFHGRDIKCAFCVIKEDSVKLTKFLGSSWERHLSVERKQLTSLKEFRNEFLNMKWSDNKSRKKMVVYFVNNINKDHAEEVKRIIELNDPVNDFINYKQIEQLGPFELRCSSIDFINAGFQNVVRSLLPSDFFHIKDTFELLDSD